MSRGVIDLALNYLADRDKWKLAGTAQGGSNTVTIPNTATEVLLNVNAGGTNFSAYFLPKLLGTMTRIELGGYF